MPVRQNDMPLSLEHIHQLEMREDYPAAIDALEERLRFDPTEHETVSRLGFNLWYAAVEDARMRKGLPIQRYANRFVELLREYQPQMECNADFCWAFGLGISLFWFEFPGTDQACGEALLARARGLARFYARMDQYEMYERFRGRGIFASYYAIAEPFSPANAAEPRR